MSGRGLKHLRQRGDTLVEVLICILIVSIILTGAYTTTSQSSRAVRDSQEHSEAMKLIQSQLEQVRQSTTNHGQPVFSQATNIPFCMVNSGIVAASDEKCKQNSGGSQASSGQVVYTVSISRADCTVGVNCSTFTIATTWDEFGSEDTASEQISYRLHK